MKANGVIDAQTNARAEAWGLAWLCPLRRPSRWAHRRRGKHPLRVFAVIPRSPALIRLARAFGSYPAASLDATQATASPYPPLRIFAVTPPRFVARPHQADSAAKLVNDDLAPGWIQIVVSHQTAQGYPQAGVPLSGSLRLCGYPGLSDCRRTIPSQPSYMRTQARDGTNGANPIYPECRADCFP
jgi:hypothetical protein